MGIFKAYDIRGVVPVELDENLARRIGHAFARFLKAKRLVVGRDMRQHSPAIADAVIEGLCDAGADVAEIGLASTPMTYYAIGSLECDGGLIVTASHNPEQYNGMKLCSAGARPISKVNGIAEIEALCARPYPGAVAERGAREEVELLDAYQAHVAGFCRMDEQISIAIDAANGMAGYTLPGLLERLPLVSAECSLMEPDGTFPVHEANPMKEENLDHVRELVRRSGSALGVSFDGDADRCCFVDEDGLTVPADLMTALLSRSFLHTHPGRPIVYDLRSSWVVKEEIAAGGGIAIRNRVGHSFIKATMRERNASFAGELSGHFYFADNYTTDSGVLAMISALNQLGAKENRGRPLSSLVVDLRRYHSTGEINFRVPDQEAAIAELKRAFADGSQDELDGITVEYGELGDRRWWWFNVRASNTESLLRLNLEASNAELRDRRRDQLIAILGEVEV